MNGRRSGRGHCVQGLGGFLGPRWRRHGVVRPTVGGVATLCVDAALWYAGLLLDDRSLMAAALVASFTLLCALVATILQWIALGSSSRVLRPLRPIRPESRMQVERLDQDGVVVSRHVGRIPTGRGVYRHAGEFIHWVGPFAMFAASRVLGRGGETIVPPEAEHAQGMDHQGVDRRRRGQSSAQDSGQVRPYAPGDPPKLISWKSTARHGELMSRETVRDTRATAVVVLDVRETGDARGSAEPDAGPSPRDVDAMASRALSYASDGPDASQGDRLIVTDGRRVAETTGHIRRFLSAVMPVGRRDDHSEGKSDDADRLAACVTRIVGRSPGASSVVLLTASPQGPLAVRLRRRIDADRLRVVDVRAEGGSTLRPDDGTDDDGKVDDGENADVGSRDRFHAGRDDGNVRVGSVATSVRNHPRRMVPAALAAVSSLALLALALASLTDLISGAAWWPWFAAVSMGTALIAASVPSGTRRRLAARLAAYVVLDAIAALAVVMLRMRDVAGPEPWADPAGTVVALAGAVAKGWDGLIVQLPPVGVDAAGDAVLMLLFAAAAALLRLLLVARGMMPSLAALTVLAFAADYALLGRQTDWWRIGLAAVAFLVACLAARHSHVHWPSAAIMTTLVTVMSLVLTPSAVRLANSVPLSIGDSTGLLSANTINPIVDLKRSLRTGSSAVVLTYRSAQRTYLRMTTLDRFDGDSWSFDAAISKDGNFYGSGIQLGRDGESNVEETSWQQWRDSPLLTYTYLMYERGYDALSAGDANGSGSANGPGASLPAGGADWYRNADVTIDTLRTRFLPVPGTMVVNTKGAGADWIHTDAAVYNRSSVTSQGMEYTAVGVGLDPIIHDSGFAQLDRVISMRDTVITGVRRSAASWQDRSAARSQAVSEGLGTQHGQWLVIPFTLEQDGTVVDLSGEAIGQMRGVSARSSTDDGQGALSGIRWAGTFRDRLAIGDDETLGLLLDKDGTNAVAVRMNGEGLSAAGTSTSEVQDDGSDGQGWGDVSGRSSYELGLLRTDLGYKGLMVDAGTQRGANRWAVSALSHIDQLDADARAGYLQLPGQLPDGVNTLVSRAQSEGVAVGGTGRDEQIAAMKWLVDYFTNPDNGFTYSLDAPDGDGRSNMAVIGDFLETKAGYCVHYASALAVTARAMGVPTRMVMGYNKGVGKATNGAYVVEAKQLHAWVEAWINGIGWVPFDVTPATSENGSAAAEMAGDTTADVTTVLPNETQAGQSDGSTADDGSGNDVSADAADASTDTGDGADGRAEVSAGGADASPTAGVGSSPWMRVVAPTLASLLAVGLLLMIPAAVRASRRRRRIHAVEMASPHAWSAALDELYDAAWDAGVRWDAACTDRMIVGRIIAFAPSSSHDATWIVEEGMRAAFAAGGSKTDSDADRAAMGQLHERLAGACAALASAGREDPAPARFIRFLFPASLRRK